MGHNSWHIWSSGRDIHRFHLVSFSLSSSSSSSSFSSPSSSLSDETCVLLRFLMNGCYFLSIGGQLNEPGRWIFICVCVCASAMDFFSCVFPGSGTVSPLGDALDSLTHPRNHSWPSTPLNPGDQGWTRGGGLVVGAFPLKSLTSSPLTPPCQRWLYPSGLFFFFSFLFFLFFFFFFFAVSLGSNELFLTSFFLSLSALRPPPSAPFLHPW